MASSTVPPAGTEIDTGDPTDAGIEEVERTREELRAKAREILGVEGRDGDGDASEAPPLRETLQKSGVGLYPLVALGLLVVVDEFQGNVLGVLGPEVARALGTSAGALSLLVGLKLLVVSLATFPVASYVQNRPHRAAVSIITALGWSLVTLFTGFVTGIGLLAAVMVADGASTGSARAVHQPLLMDSYPPEARVRAFSAFGGADAVGKIAAPLLIAGLTGLAALTWRGVFVVMGGVSLLASLVAVRLRDPGFGRWDTGRLRELVRSGGKRAAESRSELEERTQLGFFEAVRRLLQISTLRTMLASFALLGVFVVPFSTFFFFFLDQRWGLGPTQRGLFGAFTSLCALVALTAFGKYGENLFRRDPRLLIERTALMFGVTFIAISLGAIMPVFVGMAGLFGVAFAAIAVLLPALTVAVLSLVPPNLRPHTTALIGVFVAAVGGVGGTLLLGGIDRRFGVVGAMMVAAIPGVLAALVLRRAGRTIGDDLDRMIDEVVEDEEVDQIVRHGGHLPLLACSGIDFSYGQLQVLFDVDFTVDDGEMVALLGVNGAGKSTLLRVISGLGLPSNGSVRLRGADITYLDAERRTRLGISQIPGGEAVFGPMSVIENLRLYGYTLDRGDGGIDAAIEDSFEAFPRLAERRNQAAATLSGGERQMLALSKALMLKPQLLLIDELSLGLAPVIVEQLLDMVRRINDRGTAVVLVEQSVNLALTLADHAYFMEKGEIRFDGAADELLGRDDLLRAVFLEGAGKGG